MKASGVYGLMAEFADPNVLLAAAEKAYAQRVSKDGRVLAVSD